jgi:HAD superfamily hydrolase (TIGR01509 family)
MFWHFRNTAKEFPNHGPHPQSPAPETIEEQQTLIAAIQDCKTQYYKKLLASPSLQARPGVLELMDAAFQDPTIAVGVCSAATKAAAVQTLDMTLGPQRVQQLDVCILGDDVTEKKPHPMIYDTARQRLGSIASERCIVVEDSLVGLRAAKGANMKCIITYTSSTAGEDFYKEGADAKVPNLGEVTLESIFAPLREKGDTADLLAGIKDPAQTSAQS